MKNGLRIVKKARQNSDNLPLALRYGYVNKLKFMKKYIFKGVKR